MRRERWMVVATLALLQIFVVLAGTYWITHDADRTPAPVASPKPTPIPLVTAGPVLAAAGDGALPAKGTLTTRLTAAMGDPALGGSVAGIVLDVATGTPIFDGRSGTAITPASTTKLVTGLTVLATVGPDARLATRVVRGPPRGRSSWSAAATRPSPVRVRAPPSRRRPTRARRRSPGWRRARPRPSRRPRSPRLTCRTTRPCSTGRGRRRAGSRRTSRRAASPRCPRS